MKRLLASNCVLTKGYHRSLLVDLQRYKQYLISNELYSILFKRVISESDIPEEYLDICKLLIKEDILLELEDEDISLFPQMETSFDIPSIINDAIIDVDNKIHNFKKIFDQLCDLLCRHIEIRFYNDTKIEVLNEIFSKSKDSIIEAIDLYLSYHTFVNYEADILNLMRINIRFRV